MLDNPTPARSPEIDAFLALMANDPEKAVFLTESMRAQMRATAQNAFREGYLQLAFMEVFGQKAAGYFIAEAAPSEEDLTHVVGRDLKDF